MKPPNCTWNRQPSAMACTALGMVVAMMMVVAVAQVASPDGYGSHAPPAHQQGVPPSGV